MTYEKLVALIATQSQVPPEIVRTILMNTPDALLLLNIDEDVRTPLGVFRKVQSHERSITLPDGETEALVPAKTMIKLRPGTRLKIKP